MHTRLNSIVQIETIKVLQFQKSLFHGQKNYFDGAWLEVNNFFVLCNNVMKYLVCCHFEKGETCACRIQC